MNKMKKQGILRLVWQCLCFAFQNGYLIGWMRGKIYTGGNKRFCVPGLNCYSCPGALGACPMGSLQAVLDSGQYHFSLYVLGFIGAVGMFCGRFVCGWICPFGLVQDLLHKIPFAKKVKNLPGHRYLRYLRFAVLVLLVFLLPMTVKNAAGTGQPWFCEYLCPSGMLFGGIPLTAANENLRALIGPRFLWKMFVLLAVVLLSVISYRPFCKYVCPLGALYGLANPVSIYRYKVEKDACTQCGACQKACGMDIPVWKTPNSMDCIRCGKCIAVCPTGALHSTFTRKPPQPLAAKKNEAEQSMENPVIKTEEKPMGTGKKIGVVFAGLLCAVSAGMMLFVILDLIYAVAEAGVIGDASAYGQYMLNLLITFIPAVMTLILGIGLLACLAKPELMKELRCWPIAILKVIGASIPLSYILSVILAVFISGTLDPVLLITGGILMVTAAAMDLAMAVVLLITWAVIRERKRKE